MTCNEESIVELKEPKKPEPIIHISEIVRCNGNFEDLEKVALYLLEKYKEYNVLKKDILINYSDGKFYQKICGDFKNPNYHEKLSFYVKDLDTYVKLIYFK